MSKIKILVAQHKEAEVFHNDVYTPIQVGKAISKVDLSILGDNTGDNISELNPYFCELTAQYWAWKNMHDCEYVGLCHYRRYFKTEFTEENVENLMDGADIVLVKGINLNNSILNWWKSCLVPEDIDTFYLYMLKKYANNKDTFESFFVKGSYLNPSNMFVCKKLLFDDFCKWQFEILFELKDILPLVGHSREKRILGYYAEALLPFYAYEHKLKVKEIPAVSMVGDTQDLFKESIKSNIKSRLTSFHRDYAYSVGEAEMVSLKMDGILDNISKV